MKATVVAAAALVAIAASTAAAPAQTRLPREGVAVSTAHAVALYSLQGELLQTLRGYRFADAFDHQDGVAWLRDAHGRLLRLAAGRIAPARSLPRQMAYAHGSCRVGARRGGMTVELCGAPRDDRDATVVRVEYGHRAVLTHAVEMHAGHAVGWWVSASIAPSGGTVLAQWSGACEIPQSFFVDARRGGRTAIEHGREAFGLGWSGRRAVVQLLPGACGNGAKVPGVYLLGQGADAQLVVRTHGFVAARLWAP